MGAGIIIDGRRWMSNGEGVTCLVPYDMSGFMPFMDSDNIVLMLPVPSKFVLL